MTPCLQSTRIAVWLALASCTFSAPALAERIVLSPPQLVGQVTTPSDAFEVVLMGDHALVTDYDSGVEVIDILDPAAPTIVGNYDTPGYAIQCALSGGLVFVADHEQGGLQIINASNPSFPFHVGDYIPGDVAVMAAWRDGVVLVGYIEQRIDFVDVSNPSQPVLLSSFTTTGAPRHAAFDGAYAYVADHGFGLIVLDVSDPSTPGRVGEFPASRPTGVCIAGSVVYLAGMDGLRAIDVSDPSSPVEIDAIALPGPAVKVDVEGGYALVAAHVSGGLQVVDARDTSSLAVVASYVTGRYAHGVAARGDYAYFADGEGLKIFRVFDSAVTVAPTSLGRLRAMYRTR